MLQCHVPTEQDEWMQFETRALKEFTRIFPPEKKAVDKAFTEECEVEEDEGTSCLLSFLLFAPLSLPFSLLSYDLSALLIESNIPIHHLHGEITLLNAVITNLRILVPTGDDEDDASALPHPHPHPLAVEKPDALLPSKHLTVASTSSAPSSSSSSSSSGIVLCILLSSHLRLFNLLALQC